MDIVELSDAAKEAGAYGVLIVGAGVMLRWILTTVTKTLNNINDRAIEHGEQSKAEHQAMLSASTAQATAQNTACTAHRRVLEAMEKRLNGG